jgi:predicted RNA binding protein YcfA (HicA-like mRNA interferase family)
MSPKLPAIKGKQLIRLLEKDGWKKGRYATHGQTMTKFDESSDRTLVTFNSHKKQTFAGRYPWGYSKQ